MDRAVLLADDTSRRVLDATRRIERQTRSPLGSERGAQTGAVWAYVKVTGAGGSGSSGCSGTSGGAADGNEGVILMPRTNSTFEETEPAIIYSAVPGVAAPVGVPCIARRSGWDSARCKSTWQAWFGGAAGRVRVVVNAIISAQEPLSGCASGGKTKCRPYYHHVIVEVWDEDCQEWETASCAWAMEVLGRKLEIGRPYPVFFAVNAPASLEAVIVPVGTETCSLNPVLYVVDVGTPTRSILVGPRIGPLCPTSGSGGGNTTSQGVDDPLAAVPIFHHGTAFGYHHDPSCGFVPIEGVIVADVRGCPLKEGEWVDAHFNEMVPDSLIGDGSGSGAIGGHCTPSYLLAREKKTGDRIECCSGGGFHIFRYTGNCDEVSIENCGCLGGSGGGSGGSTSCPCDGVPRADTFRISTFGPRSNGDCLNCGFLPSSFDVTHGINNCSWQSTTLPNPCGGTMGATLVVNSDGSADLYIGAGDARFNLHYHKDSGFACNGTNSGLNLVSGGSACASWPATLTATPV